MGLSFQRIRNGMLRGPIRNTKTRVYAKPKRIQLQKKSTLSRIRHNSKYIKIILKHTRHYTKLISENTEKYRCYISPPPKRDFVPEIKLEWVRTILGTSLASQTPSPMRLLSHRNASTVPSPTGSLYSETS